MASTSTDDEMRDIVMRADATSSQRAAHVIPAEEGHGSGDADVGNLIEGDTIICPPS